MLQLTCISVSLGAAAFDLAALEAVAPLAHYAAGATTLATLVDYARRPGLSTTPGPE